MTENTPKYQEMVSALAKDGAAIVDSLTPQCAHTLHMAIGLSGEAGELLDAIKKWAIYEKPLDMRNVIEELGDLEFYMEGLRQGLGISRGETLRANTVKLGKRYAAGKFTNEQAQARADKEQEDE